MFTPIEISGGGRLIPSDREFWTSPDMIRKGKPVYANGDVAKLFMGRSTIWLKMRIWRGFGATDDLGEINPERSDGGHRRWTLYEVERLARTFLQEGALGVADYMKTINMIKAQAYLYDFDIGDDDPMAPVIPFDIDSVREKALHAVLKRLDEEDRGEIPEDRKEAADEHLIARTAWSMRGLEDYYRGLMTDD